MKSFKLSRSTLNTLLCSAACLILSPLPIYAQSCQSFLAPHSLKTADLIENKMAQLRSKREALEDMLLKDIGDMSQDSYTALESFRSREGAKQPHEVLSQNHIMPQMEHDSVLAPFSQNAKGKLSWLLSRDYASPRIAFLIARYMDSIENPGQLHTLDFESLERIDPILTLYIYERALAKSAKDMRRVSYPQSSINDVLAFVESTSAYKHQPFNYKNPLRHMVLSNFFESRVQEVKDELASIPSTLWQY